MSTRTAHPVCTTDMWSRWPCTDTFEARGVNCQHATPGPCRLLLCDGEVYRPLTVISFHAESVTGPTARGKSGPALGGADAFGLLLPLATAMCCINYCLLAAVFLGYTVVLYRVGLEKKIIKNPPLGLLSPFFHCSTGDIFRYNVIEPFGTILFRTGDIVALSTVGSEMTPMCKATVKGLTL